MSTILDALKKSEQERKLKKLPTLADMPAPQEPSRWPLYLGLGLATILLAVLVLLLGEQSVQPEVTPRAPIVLNNQTIEDTSGIDPEASVVVNVVSYSEKPAKRFVMINGKMFRENEFVRAGLKVIEITEQGVVLNERGRRIVKQP